ncbi:MAG: di-heme oxidoredictase family protein, partial [Pseudomonadota bacterium]
MKKAVSLSLLLPIGLFVALEFFVGPTNTRIPLELKSEALPGGDGSVSIKPFASFLLPAANLPEESKPNFHAGKALAHQPWIKSPTTTDARDGLGPVYNARTCLACHTNGGRGLMPDSPDTMVISGVLRLSLPGEDIVLGAVPEPFYGTQLQSQSISLVHQLRNAEGIESTESIGTINPEGYIYVSWSSKDFVYPDGTSQSLRTPHIQVRNLGYGDFQANTRTSLRNAPPIHGAGLLQLIPQSDIDALADPEDQDGDGVSGRVNQVWDFSAGKSAPGRFGLKANSANIRDQVAAAFNADVGIVSSVFPDQPCSTNQPECLHAIHGDDSNGHEISDPLLELVIDFTRSLAVPERRKPNHPMVKLGRGHFYRAGCASCHYPSFRTATDERFPHLSDQTIWPYTDLLVHDMG